MSTSAARAGRVQPEPLAVEARCTDDGVAEILNLQPRGAGEPKPYQVRQVRGVVLKYGLAQLLAGEGDNEA